MSPQDVTEQAKDDPTDQEWVAEFDPEDTLPSEPEPEDTGPVPIHNLVLEPPVVLAPTPYVVVWTHDLTEPDRFSRGLAQVLPNGTLLITRPFSKVPVKGYAPGAWREFEHVGEEYHSRPQPIALTPSQGRLVPPSGTPWELEEPSEPELAADDTRDIPAVQESREQEQPRPKAAGADVAPRTASRVRPESDDPGTPVGPLRAFWRSLIGTEFRG